MHRLATNAEEKMSSSFLKTLTECFTFDIFQSEWICKIKKILDNCGLSFVWTNPHSVSTTWLSNKLDSQLKDIHIQTWSQQCENSSKACNYNLFKPTYGIEKYLDALPDCYRISLTKLRTANHKLPVEKGRYINVPREERTCCLCDSGKTGDEFHFLLECEALKDIRLKYLPQYYCTRPNFFKYSVLLANESKSKLLKLGKYIFEGFKLFK